MEQQIRDALTQAFGGAQVELETSPDGRYSGLLIWEGFVDEDSVDRHRQVRQVLTNALKGGAANIGMLFEPPVGFARCRAFRAAALLSKCHCPHSFFRRSKICSIRYVLSLSLSAIACRVGGHDDPAPVPRRRHDYR